MEFGEIVEDGKFNSFEKLDEVKQDYVTGEFDARCILLNGRSYDNGNKPTGSGNTGK